MKTQTEIERSMNHPDLFKSEYPGMSYEEGVKEALEWVVGQISDDEWEYS